MTRIQYVRGLQSDFVYAGRSRRDHTFPPKLSDMTNAISPVAEARIALYPQRALSVMQPWADLIVTGVKRIENRGRIAVPGGMTRFAIHAGKKYDADSEDWIRETLYDGPYDWSAEQVNGFFEIARERRGKLLGEVSLRTTVPTVTDLLWRSLEASTHLQIENAIDYRDEALAQKVFDAKGQLGFWNLHTAMKLIAASDATKQQASRPVSRQRATSESRVAPWRT